MKNNIIVLCLPLISFLALLSGCKTVQKKDVSNERDTASISVAKEEASSADNIKRDTLEGFRFDVDTVKIAEAYLNTNVLSEVFPEKIHQSKISYIPKEQLTQQIVSSYDNGLLEAVTIAYNTHYPLVLSPDIVWLNICQGMAIHINENFESLEKVIFKNGHSKVIKVRNDSLGRNDDAWSDLIDSLSAQTKQYTDSVFYDAFVPKFSTTTSVEHVTYEITILYAQQKAYRYVAESGCGIPYITLKGTTEDWEKLKSKLNILDSLNLSHWRACLDPIMDQFVNASKGIVDKKFWRNIYKDRWDYDPIFITGWIHKLFPYIIDNRLENVEVDEDGNGKSMIKYLPNPYLDKKVKSTDSLSKNRFPCGVVDVPFQWINHYVEETKNMRFYAGFIGIKQYADKSIEPFISWAVCEDGH